MRLGSTRLNWMGGDNDAIWVWIDLKFRGWWYVLLWRKGKRPYAYYSRDATPPTPDNGGRFLFGRVTGIND